MKVTFDFTVTYKGTMDLPDDATDQDIEEAIADFNIPEGEDCKYIEDSFEADEDSIDKTL